MAPRFRHGRQLQPGAALDKLVLPYFAQSKAFYAFPALLPFSALVAVGWDWLRQRHRAVGIAVWVLLLVWSMTVYTSFWVRSANPATQLVRITELGAALLRQGKLDEAIGQYQEAIRLKPDYANAHNNLGHRPCQERPNRRGDPPIPGSHPPQTGSRRRPQQPRRRPRPERPNRRGDPPIPGSHPPETGSRRRPHNLGVALYQQGRTDEAIRQFQEAIRLKPDHAEAHNNLGTALSGRANRRGHPPVPGSPATQAGLCRGPQEPGSSRSPPRPVLRRRPAPPPTAE